MQEGEIHHNKRMCIALAKKGDGANDGDEVISDVSARLIILKQVDEGFKRRDKDFLRSTFDSLKDQATGSIGASSLEKALKKFADEVSFGIFG